MRRWDIAASFERCGVGSWVGDGKFSVQVIAFSSLTNVTSSIVRRRNNDLVRPSRPTSRITLPYTIYRVSAIYSYGSDCYPSRQGEVSALLNGWRTMLGFAVAFWEVPFAFSHGPLLEFGAQSA